MTTRYNIYYLSAKRCQKFLILILFINLSNYLQGQEFHYWNNQVGAQSSILGGAVTASGNDNTAVYYNPGTLGFKESTSLSFSSDTYYLSWINIENGSGQNRDLRSSEFNIYPQIISFNQKIPNLPISVTLAVINRKSSLIKTNDRNEMKIDILNDHPGDELYIGSIDYYSRLRENWIGLGYGRKLGRYFGIGISSFVSIWSIEYRYSQNADVYSQSSGTNFTNLAASSSIIEYLDLRNVGLMFLAGFSYQREKYKLGVNITLPRLNVGILSNSSLRRSVSHYIPEVDTNSIKISNWNENLVSVYKTPFSIDIGLESDLSPSTILYLKASWFSKVNTYAMIRKESDETEHDFNNIYMANEQVVNFALAIKSRINENIHLLSSIRTDFNYFNREILPITNSNYFYGITYWDIYHVTGGVLWDFEKFNLNAGAGYSFGRDGSMPQVINLTDPTVENQLFGIPQNSSTAKYNQISVYLGFTYYFKQK